MDTEVRTTAVVTHVSWKAIFAGAFIAMAIQYALALMGLGIGLATINPASGDVPGTGLGIGAAIWWIIISVVALYFGGWVSSRLAGILSASEAVLHGLVTWALFSLLGLYVMTSTLGAIVGGGLNVIKNAASASGQVAQAVPGVGQQLQQQAQQQQQQLQQQAQQMTPEEKQAMQQKAEQQAKETAEKAAQAAAKAAWGVFIMLVLGGAAAAFGARAGRTAGPVRT
ncbi:MAG: hypothetical protein ACYC5N_07115 [Endomicrobiales bacterium]